MVVIEEADTRTKGKGKGKCGNIFEINDPVIVHRVPKEELKSKFNRKVTQTIIPEYKHSQSVELIRDGCNG